MVCAFVVCMQVWFTPEVAKITAVQHVASFGTCTYFKEKLKILKRSIGFERPVASRVQKVNYRHELKISNFNGVHININLFDHYNLTGYHSMGRTGPYGQIYHVLEIC